MNLIKWAYDSHFKNEFLKEEAVRFTYVKVRINLTNAFRWGESFMKSFAGGGAPYISQILFFLNGKFGVIFSSFSVEICQNFN